MALGMFVITTIIGLLPSRIDADKRIMNLIAIYGAGLLVGAALIVIVPEGMVVLVSALKPQGKKLPKGVTDDEVNDQIAHYIGASLVFGFAVMLLIDQGFIAIKEMSASNSSS